MHAEKGLAASCYEKDIKNGCCSRGHEEREPKQKRGATVKRYDSREPGAQIERKSAGRERKDTASDKISRKILEKYAGKLSPFAAKKKK